MSNVIDIQGRFLKTPEPAGVDMRRPSRRPAAAEARGVVVELSVRRASVDHLSRDIRTCQEAISLLEVTIDAAERIEALVAEMAALVSPGAQSGFLAVPGTFDTLSTLRDMRSRCASIAFEADYMGVRLAGPAGARSLKPGLNPAGFGDIVLGFVSPLSNDERTYRLEARDLSPAGIGLPVFHRTETGIMETLLEAGDKTAHAGDYFRRQSDFLKSLCMDFTGRWERCLERGHRVKDMSSALESARFLDARITREGRASGNAHDEERLRSCLQKGMGI